MDRDAGRILPLGLTVERMPISALALMGSWSVSTIALAPLLPRLEVLRCGNIGLYKLDLSAVPGLTELSCINNQLTELDLSPVPGLTELRFDKELRLRNAPRGLDTDGVFESKPGQFNSGLAFDEKTYEQAKPLFISGVKHFAQAGAGIADLVKALVRALVKEHGMSREGVENMRLYINRFMQDVNAGVITLDEPKPLDLNDQMPEIMQDGFTLAGYHIEAGSRKFGDFAKEMIADLGNAAKPYLRVWYESVRYYPGLNNQEMTPIAEMDAAVAALEAETEAAKRQ